MGPSGSGGRRVSPGSRGGLPDPVPLLSPHPADSGRVSSRTADAVPPAPAGDGDLRGRVVTADRRAVAFASVAVSGGPAHPDVAALTDDDGRFVLPVDQAGAYELTVHKAGFPPETVRADTAGGAVTVVLRGTA